jgi:hypothetical protein
MDQNNEIMDKVLRRKNTIESSSQRVVGNIFPNENAAFCAPLLHSLQGPRVVRDVLFDFEQE